MKFDASATRGVRVANGLIDELIPGVDSFSWYWTFYPEEVVSNFIDDVSERAYMFTANFPVAGENSVTLRVEV